MKEFLLFLLFGKSILLTPMPVTIGPNCINLNSVKPLKAINGSAVLEVRIHPGTNGTLKIVDTVAAPQQIERMYPSGSVTATLFRADGSKVNAVNSDVATANDFYGLGLYPLISPNASKSTIPGFREGDKFTRITICSKNPITDIQVYWQTAME